SVNSMGATPLIHASKNGRDELVSLLLLYGANIEAVTNMGSSSLLKACQNGQVSTARILIEKGANPYARNRDGNSPIQIAIRKGYEELVLLMNNPPIERLHSMS
ncbi:unnamed protein product, partial [Meganyctiphanes norvegica]